MRPYVRYHGKVACRRWFLGVGALLWLTTATWAEPYFSPDGRFTASLSPQTVRSTSLSSSPLGDIATTVFLDRQPGRFLTVSFTDLPPMAMLAGRVGIFEDARDGMLQQCQGEMLSWVKENRSSRRLTYRVSGEKTYRGETLFRMEKFRLYVVDVRSEVTLKPAIDKQFLSSFRIQPPAAALGPEAP